MNCITRFSVLVLALFILACSRGNAVEIQEKKIQPSIGRALFLDGILIQPLDIVEWKGEEWLIIESFGYIAREYSYFLANLASGERFLIAGLSQAGLPLKFSNFVLGMKEASFFGVVDGKVIKYSYDRLGVIRQEPVVELDAKDTVQSLYFYKDKLYVVVSRRGFPSLAIIDVDTRKVNAVEVGAHKFSKIWDFSVTEGSLLLLGSLAFVDDSYSAIRYFELDMNSGAVLQYQIPIYKKEAILSARIINGGDQIGLMYVSRGGRKARVYKKKNEELSFSLSYADETSGIEDVVLFSACGGVGQVSVVTSNGDVGLRPFLTMGKVKHDLYPEIENQIFYKNLFVLEEGEEPKIGVEFVEIIDYKARSGVAVYNVDDSLCSRVKSKNRKDRWSFLKS